LITQRFKSSVSKSTSIRPEHSSSNVENSFVSNVKFADYFFKLRDAMFSAVWWRWDRLKAQHIAFCSILFEMKSDANIVAHQSIGTNISGQQNLTGFVELFSLVSVDDLCSHQGRRQRRASGARPPHLKSVTPHFTFGPWLLHTSNTVF